PSATVRSRDGYRQGHPSSAPPNCRAASTRAPEPVATTSCSDMMPAARSLTAPPADTPPTNTSAANASPGDTPPPGASSADAADASPADVWEFHEIAGIEVCDKEIIFLLKATKEGGASLRIPEAELQEMAPAAVAQYWALYNNRHEKEEGDAGGWRPCDRLPPYTTQHEKKGLHHPLRIQAHKKVKRGVVYRWQILVEWLRWPADDGWTWEDLDVVARNRPILERYITETLEGAGKPDLDQEWYEGVSMKAQMDEMGRRLGRA
ncbi:hypothetical protein QBC39DRAFT_34287, partial [Podospora conica]